MQKQGLLFNDEKIDSDRTYQADYMADKRAKERDIEIDRSRQDQRRRARCKKRPDLFCRTYFPHIFYNAFTKDQKVIIDSIKQRILYSGRAAIAAERGGGKSSITKIVGAVWAVVYGYVDYIVILRANGDEAQSTLTDIKNFYETNEKLADDFPEICHPILALEGSAQRANAQTVNGQRTKLKWASREINFAKVEGSSASGTVVVCRGVDSAIRGLVKEEKRPKLVISDDVETRASAESVVDTQRRKKTIEQDVMGLAGPGKEMAIVFLGTIINRRCLTFQYTDRKKNPQWNGIRQRWIKKFPKNSEMWDRYIEVRRDDFYNGDPTGRSSLGYYRKNRKAMDLGSLVSNKKRFIDKAAQDGSRLEISSLQSAYNIIADGGWDNFNTEYQNAPPEDEQFETLGISKRIIMSRTCGMARGLVPFWVEYLTAGIDIGRRLLHYTVVGWTAGMVGQVIDYGTEPVFSPDGDHKSEDVQRGIADAVLLALLQWRDSARDNGWPAEDGNSIRHLDKVCIDAGYMDAATYAFTRSDTTRTCVAVKGYGSAQKTKFRMVGKQIKRGSHWFGSWQSNDKVWLYHVDSDFWKQFIHSGFLLDPGQPGSIVVFGSDRIVHSEFAKQICAEQWVKEFKSGKGFIDGFRQNYRNNHFLDSTQYAAAAAAIAGARSLTVDAPGQPKRKISLREKQKEMRNKR